MSKSVKILILVIVIVIAIFIVYSFMFNDKVDTTKEPVKTLPKKLPPRSSVIPTLNNATANSSNLIIQS